MTPAEKKIRSTVLMVAQVLKLLGVKEHGGQNSGEVVETLLRSQGGWKGLPWCVAFAAWVYESACKIAMVKPAIDINLGTSDALRKAEALGRIKEPAEAKTGDIILMGWDGSWRHTAIVKLPPDKNGVITTIEGNTNSAGGAEGDGVWERTRNPKHLEFCKIIDITP